MTIYPRLGHNNKCAFIPVYVVPEKKRKPNKKGHEEQNKKNRFPIQVFVIGRRKGDKFFKHGPD